MNEHDFPLVSTLDAVWCIEAIAKNIGHPVTITRDEDHVSAHLILRFQGDRAMTVRLTMEQLVAEPCRPGFVWSALRKSLEGRPVVSVDSVLAAG